MADIVVLSVDDSEGFAYIIGRWLQSESRIHHTAHINSAAAMYEMVSLLRPRVVVIDLHTPGADALEEMQRVLADFPETRFVAMTSDANEAQVALRGGAVITIDKDYGRAQLPGAVSQAADAVRPAMRTATASNHAMAEAKPSRTAPRSCATQDA